MFSYKMVILKGFWIFFALALPTHVFDPFLSILFFHRLISVRLHDLNRLVCTSSAGLHWNSFYGGRVNLMTWRMKPGSVPHYASGILVNFTPRLQLRGGVERIPGFMCSESRDAARAAKNRVIVYLQHSSSEEYFIN